MWYNNTERNDDSLFGGFWQRIVFETHENDGTVLLASGVVRWSENEAAQAKPLASAKYIKPFLRTPPAVNTLLNSLCPSCGFGFFPLYFPRVHGSLWVKLLSEPITICMDWIGSNPCIFNQIRTQPNGFELGQVDSNLFLNWNSPPIPNQLGICRVGSEGENILGRFGFHELSANTPYLFCFYFYFML